MLAFWTLQAGSPSPDCDVPAGIQMQERRLADEGALSAGVNIHATPAYGGTLHLQRIDTVDCFCLLYLWESTTAFVIRCFVMPQHSISRHSHNPSYRASLNITKPDHHE